MQITNRIVKIKREVKTIKRQAITLLAAIMLAGTMAAGTTVFAEDAGDFTVGMTLNLGNLTWAELSEAAKAHGKELGMNVEVQNSNDDATTQVAQIENFIQAGVDAIIVAAVESNAIEDVCKEAMDAGIKVIAYTQVVENSDAEYLVDAYNTGYACGKRAAEWINEKYADAEEVQWALEDLPKYPEIIDRANGIKEAIEELAPNAVLVATQSAEVMEDGQKNAENFMQSNPDIKVICSIGSGGGAGANEGVKSYISEDEYDTFGIFGIDATEQEIFNIINGDPQKSSVSLGGGAVHGEMLIDIADNFRNGVEQEKDRYMPILVVDASNAEEYYAELFEKK